MKLYEKIQSMSIDELSEYLAKVSVRSMNDPNHAPFEEITEAFKKVLKESEAK